MSETYKLAGDWGLQKLLAGNERCPEWAITFKGMQWSKVEDFLPPAENGRSTLDDDMRALAASVAQLRELLHEAVRVAWADAVIGTSHPDLSRGRKALDEFHAWRRRAYAALDQAGQRFAEEDCPGHVASETDPKVCGRCGVHIDSLRPSEPDVE